MRHWLYGPARNSGVHGVKMVGGYAPRIAGRPLSVVREIPLPRQLVIPLEQRGIRYAPVVRDGDTIQLGRPLAQAPVVGGTLALPAPASGRVSLQQGSEMAAQITLLPATPDKPTETGKRLEAQRATPDNIRSALAEGGVWPFFWSSLTGGLPALDDSERPKAIIVNCVTAEPFRTRGKVILRRSWDRIVQGIRFLPRLMADYGTIEVILTDQRDSVARMMYVDLAGHAWTRFHPLPVLYPVEHPAILTRMLRRSVRSLKKNDPVWVIDVQGVEALGACLVEGVAMHERIIAIGGPGCANPSHLAVRVGTPLASFIPEALRGDLVRVLRGGLFSGAPVDLSTTSVHYDDDAFFFLPEPEGREFLSFVRPGMDRCSRLPCFVSGITRASDSHISTALRGERRPCIACGLCEKVCPAGLLPQVLHRYLYREAFDEAESAGLDLCVDCGLCTYVCPSKIELQQQFDDARETLRIEKQEAREAEERAAAAEEQALASSHESCTEYP